VSEWHPGDLVRIVPNGRVNGYASLYLQGFLGQMGIVVGEGMRIKGSQVQHWEVMVEGRVILVPGMNMGHPAQGANLAQDDIL
jgi:hypothetical protein